MTPTPDPDKYTIAELVELLDFSKSRIMEAVYAVYPQSEWPGSTKGPGRRRWEIDQPHFDQIIEYLARPHRTRAKEPKPIADEPQPMTPRILSEDEMYELIENIQHSDGPHAIPADADIEGTIADLGECNLGKEITLAEVTETEIILMATTI